MKLTISEFGFDAKTLIITSSMFGVQAIMGAVGLPAIINRMAPEKFGLLTIIMGGPLGFAATHLTSRLLGKSKIAIRVNMVSSLKMDAMRGAIFLALEISAAALTIALGL
jgi:hypothetical protein